MREDTVVDEGDTAALDALGKAPPGYRLLPAHPWQLELTAPALAPAFADGRLVRVGTTGFFAWPTAAIRTVYAPEYLPGRDLFLKFSLDVRVTNDIRRLWRHDLMRLRRTDTAVTEAFASVGPPPPGSPTAATAPRTSPSRNWPSSSATACATTSCPARPRSWPPPSWRASPAAR